jgi:hypothetical protein
MGTPLSTFGLLYRYFLPLKPSKLFLVALKNKQPKG